MPKPNSKGKLPGETTLKMPDGSLVSLPNRWINDREQTIDWSSYRRCDHCGTYVGDVGNMLGACGRLSVFFLDEERRATHYVVSCHRCVYGALAHRSYRSADFKRPGVPYDYEHERYIPQDLTQQEWTLLKAYHAKGMTYGDTARRVDSTHPAAPLLRSKVERWERERAMREIATRPASEQDAEEGGWADD